MQALTIKVQGDGGHRAESLNGLIKLTLLPGGKRFG